MMIKDAIGTLTTANLHRNGGRTGTAENCS
jgi:hypothetical protein